MVESNVEFSNIAEPIDIEKLTTGSADGSGVFDKIMTSMLDRLETEYKLNRIQSTDYSKVYLGSMEAAMSQAIAFLLGKDKSYYESNLIDAQASQAIAETELIAANVKKTDAEVYLINQQTLNLTQEYLNIQQEVEKRKEEVKLIKQQVLNAKYDGDILQLEDDRVQADTKLITVKTDIEEYRRDVMLSTENELLISNKNLVTAQSATEANNTMLVGHKVDTEAMVTVLTENQGSNVLEESKLTAQRILTENENTTLTSNNAKVSGQSYWTEYFKSYSMLMEGYAVEAKTNKTIARWNPNTMNWDSTETTIDGTIKIEREILEEEVKKVHNEGWSIKNAGYIAQAQVLDTVKVINLCTLEEVEMDVGGVVLAQRDKLNAEADLIAQKSITELAQTNTQADGTNNVSGVVGAQIDLYNKQKDGYDRKAEADMAKISADGYAVQRGTDSEHPPPVALDNTYINTMISYAQHKAMGG